MVISTERVHNVITRLPDGIGVPGVLMAKITPSDFCFSNFFVGMPNLLSVGHSGLHANDALWCHEREQEGK